MKQSALSFLLVLLIEAICAVVTYLKDRLMHHMYRDHGGTDFDTEFA